MKSWFPQTTHKERNFFKQPSKFPLDDFQHSLGQNLPRKRIRYHEKPLRNIQTQGSLLWLKEPVQLARGCECCISFEAPADRQRRKYRAKFYLFSANWPDQILEIYWAPSIRGAFWFQNPPLRRDNNKRKVVQFSLLKTRFYHATTWHTLTNLDRFPAAAAAVDNLSIFYKDLPTTYLSRR